MARSKEKSCEGERFGKTEGSLVQMNTNSLAVSTNEILKSRSSWEEGSGTWCDGRSVKELKCLRENEVKVSTCLDAETGC